MFSTLQPSEALQRSSTSYIMFAHVLLPHLFRQKNLIASLKRVQDAASDIQTAIRLFQEVDEDGSGKLRKIADVLARLHQHMHI